MTLLDSALDYAGLFPPASLAMADAARRYASYLRGPAEQRALLGRFVVPIARLDELGVALHELPPDEDAPPLDLSLVAAGEPGADRRCIDTFLARQSRAGRAVSVGSVERRVESVNEIRAAAEHDREPVCDRPAWRLYLEVAPGPQASALLEAIGASAACAKVRTGGTTADAFPSTDTLARFVVACAEQGVAFKATAGLHHAVRGEHRVSYETQSPYATMHGFVNLFVGAALLDAGRISSAELAAVLEERDPSAFQIGTDADGAARWRDRAATPDEVRRARTRLLHSFGSCSFDEPVAELRALGWLR